MDGLSSLDEVDCGFASCLSIRVNGDKRGSSYFVVLISNTFFFNCRPIQERHCVLLHFKMCIYYKYI